VAEQADVRDFKKLKAAVAKGVSELGRIDFVLANAGILPIVGSPDRCPTPGRSATTSPPEASSSPVYRTLAAAEHVAAQGN
jgi:NAD(P)-dependent dehydrogenase (short-subunit alcohol dehydrogenase family)